MHRFLIKRTIGAILVLLLTSFFTFELLYLAPGDPAAVIALQKLGRIPDANETARFAAEYGLDRPIIFQYVDWLKGVVQGDFGNSIQTGKPVVQELQTRFLPTFTLASATALFTLMIGIPIGFLTAIRSDSFWDHFSRIFGLIGVSIPDFWLAFLLILFFSVQLRWLPTHGWDSPVNLIMPALSLGVANAARLSRLTRSCLLEVKFQDYLRTARARGVSEGWVWVRHALPNVALPLVTLMVNQFSAIVAGSVVIETLFALPGMGQFYVVAVRYNDIPVIQATILLISFSFVLINLLTDIAYALLDHRIRLE
jgi:peptide/nickel transport system permease protein